MLKTEKKLVTYRDGRSENIPVAVQLTIEELYNFIRYIGASDTPALVAMCCAKDKSWINLIKPQSFGELAAFCVERNFPDAMEIIAADPIAGLMAQSFLRGIGESLKSLTAEQLEQLKSVTDGTNISNASKDKSPAPAPSESAEETSTASSQP